MYFKLQTALSVLLALTRPSDLSRGGKGGLFLLQGNSGTRDDRWTVTMPLVGMIVLAATNMLILVPTTHKYVLKVHLGKWLRTSAPWLRQSGWYHVLTNI